MVETANSLQTTEPSASSLRLVRKPLVMIIESDPNMRRQLSEEMRTLGYNTIDAANQKEAEQKTAQLSDRADVLIIDWPATNDIDMSWAKNLPQTGKGRIPVILLLDSNRPDLVKAAVDAGIIYYLTKPIVPGLLQTIVNTILRDTQRQSNFFEAWNKQRASFELMETCSFSIKTIDQAEDLAYLLANFFPNPQRVLIGIAELLINAVEHGNLGLGYEAKMRFNDEKSWDAEIKRRLAMPENENKLVQVVFQHSAKGFYLSIKDQGKGFDWRNYMYLNLSRVSDYHGRGIALANLVSFDKLVYNEAGNQVTAYISSEPELSW